MRYLVITNNSEPFITKWFDPENHFNAEIGMIVYDLVNSCYTKDGKTWLKIKADHL